MRAQHVLLAALAVVARGVDATLLSRPPVRAMAARQDPSSPPPPDANAIQGKTVLMVDPAYHNTTKVFPTCSVIALRWLYTNQYSILDTFSMFLTNDGVVPPPPVTATSSSSSTPSPSIASVFNSGTFPPPAQFVRRAPPPGSNLVNIQIFKDHDVMSNPHSVDWTVSVPAGWYKLTAVPTNPGTDTVFKDSNIFQISAGDTACFNAAPSTPGASGPPPQDTNVAEPSGGTNKSGVIAGAVVGSILGLAAVAGLFFACFLLRRRKDHIGATPRSAGAWGHVNSKESTRAARTARGLPVGAPNRLSRHAEAMVPDLDHDSVEEKYAPSGPSSSGHSPTDGTVPIYRRHSSQMSPGAIAPSGHGGQAYALAKLSTHQPSTKESRRSTIQSIPTTVTPTSTTPLASPSPAPTPIQEVAVVRSNSVARKVGRKPVPAYDAGEGGTSNSSKRNSLDASTDGTHEGADMGAQPISASQRSDAGLLHAFPFELDGAKGQVHYLIPDPPMTPRR